MDKSIKEELLFFDINYEFVFSHFFYKNKKIYIGRKDEKTCRFCHKKKPEVSFSNVSHAIPQFLGNNELISLFECDNCNSFFSLNLENHLDNFTKPLRTLAQVKGKKKVPIYKSKNNNTRAEHSISDGLKIISTAENPGRTLDIENKTLHYTLDIGSYIPTAVYKCLAKIALSIIPEEKISNFSQSIHWIMRNEHSLKLFEPQTLIYSFIPGHNPYRVLGVNLMIRKNDNRELPYCILVLSFGNIVYQIMLPSDADIKHNGKSSTMVLHRFPTPFDNNCTVGEVVMEHEDLSSHEFCSDRKLPIQFVFDSIKKEKLDE